jgi:predicted glycoside hydrolase/deacetylase ChbG (UPF0249 family)
MIRLVVSAEDFGLRPDITEGILVAHREGIVTNAMVRGNDPALPDRALLLAENPSLGVGLSLTLVGGLPVAPVATVPSLVEDGCLPNTLATFLEKWARDRLSPNELVTEMDAQVTRARALGLPLSVLAAPDELACLPMVGQAMETVARRHGITGLRASVEPPSLSWLGDPVRGLESGVLAGLSWLTRRRLGARRHGPRTWGHHDAGSLTEIRIVELLGRMAPGAHEIVCHPGLSDEPRPGGQLTERAMARRQELDALRSPRVRQALALREVQLCRWGDL